MPVGHQLVIALFQFGPYGNAASVESIVQWAGVSAGMPNAKEKEVAKEWVEAASCAVWRNGWILVDRTLVPLAEKPAYHGEAYFDRKFNYLLNLITLPNLQIIDYVIGHCSSAHDSTTFNNSHNLINHQQLLGPGEWICADSAYPIEAWCITPYKKPTGNISDNKTFNFWVCIHLEHAVSHLKGCFQSLKGLQQQIKSRDDHLYAVEWIRACLVIHTIIHEIEEFDFDSEYSSGVCRAKEVTKSKRRSICQWYSGI
ncbi:hypothetical protein ARMGADRAFT_1046786 [Armillaria gallica]|uniref:DDE Tnp4 domain-containing protein n=1 Tax=Armillaria gallica TaxID=47427 RepID=A0A2H3DAV7_ARMGA|nr:hypothetical protein ARMGADRAFT_1046786 [Armillaria gallica]